MEGAKVIPVIIFEKGGFVYVYSCVDEAETHLEAWDLQEGFFTAAFAADGERLGMSPASDGLFVRFHRTGINEPSILREMLLDNGFDLEGSSPSEWAADQLN